METLFAFLAIFIVTVQSTTWTAPGWTATPFVVNFSQIGGPLYGSLGLTFDNQGNFYFNYYQCLAKINAPLTAAPYSPTTPFDLQNCNNNINPMDDMAVDGLGRLWVVRSALYQLDLVSLAINTSATVGIAGAGGGLARDPLSGDIMIDVAAKGIYRLNITSNTVTEYYQYPQPPRGDGISFGPDGSLYIGETYCTLGGNWNCVSKISGTNVASTGTLLAQYPIGDYAINGAPSTTYTADGLAVSTDGQFLIGNCHDLTTDGDNGISQVVLFDLVSGTQQTIFTDTNFYRGDFGKVGPDCCFYFTHEPDSIWKLCNPNICFTGGCVPKKSCSSGLNCGSIDDGCDGTITCGGNCCGFQTCGGGETENVCGCTPKSSCPPELNCGSIDDGCGGTISCGNCTVDFQTCGGGGTENVCGSSITLAFSNPSPNCGDSIQITATVSGSEVPDGVIGFIITQGDIQIGQVVDLTPGTLSNTAIAEYTWNIGSPGDYEITAVSFNGDQNNECSSISQSLTVGDNPVPTKIVFSISNSTPVCGQVVYLSVTLSTTCSTPTGSVTLTFTATGNWQTVTVPLVDGVATTSTSLTPGTYTVAASYPGDAHSLPANATWDQYVVVAKAPCFVNLNIIGSLDIIVASILNWAGICGANQPGISILPTGGQLSLYDGNSQLVLVNLLHGFGNSSCKILGIGLHPLTCHYAGDACFNPCISVVVSLTAQLRL